MSGAIDRYLPEADIVDERETLVRAPPSLVYAVASELDLQSIPVVRAIFWLRERFLPSRPREVPQGIVEQTKALGWGVLEERPGREIVMGAVTQPWRKDTRFAPVERDRFADFWEPGLVKIAWTIEAEPEGPELTRFRQQTRAVATDEGARRKFRWYWRAFGGGVRIIHRLATRATKREAERRYRQIALGAA